MDKNRLNENLLDPISRYRTMIERGEIHDDAEQRLIVEKLSLLVRRMKTYSPEKESFARVIFGWGREKVTMEQIQGLYIYGSVGRGKSMLMELLVDALPEQTWRVHFIDFMRDIHKRLDVQREKNERDPMVGVINDISASYRLLALDEMQVENIADAMIVGRLFEGLFNKGVVLVTTSNRHPKDLYKSGLNRDRFEPFIKEIENNCEVVCLDGSTDYRGTHARGGNDQNGYYNGYYFAPLNSKSQVKLDKAWVKCTKSQAKSSPLNLDVGGREWIIKSFENGCARVDFGQACEEARGAADYIALSEKAHTVFIDNMPILTNEYTSAARRFVTMIDVFYEAKTKLYMRMDAPLDKIHSDQNTSFIFNRTLSRLNEMASQKWAL